MISFSGADNVLHSNSIDQSKLSSSMGSLLLARTWPAWHETDGESFRLPIAYRDLTACVLICVAPSKAVQALLPDQRLVPQRLTPCFSLISISFFDYRDCDLAPYLEASISVPVRLEGSGSRAVQALDEPSLHYVHRLPVTTEQSVKIGRGVWGFPKTLGAIEMSTTRERFSATVDVSGDYHMDVNVDLFGAIPRIHRLRYRPMTAGPEGLTIAHFSVEGTLAGKPRLGIKPVKHFSGDQAIGHALMNARLIRGLIMEQAHGLLTGPIEAL